MTDNILHIIRRAYCIVLLTVASVLSYAQVTASFSLSATSGCGSTVIEITDASLGSPDSWSWDFGNGVTKIETKPKAYKFTYKPGTYTITLQVQKGDSYDTMSEVLTIYSEPEVDFDLSSFSGCVGSEALFVDKSSSDFSIEKYEWMFGDAGVSTIRNPKHTYLTEGDYSVSLMVIDENGCSAEMVKNGFVHVTDLLSFSLNTNIAEQCTAPLTTQFSTTCSDSDVESYLWDFGDGTTSQDVAPSHTYTQDGVYTVSVTAQASSGCPTKRVFEDYIQINAHTATIIVPDTVCFGERNAISVESSIPIVSCDWNFGDGASIDGGELSVSHAYESSGVKTITATVYGEIGCERTTTKQVFVRAKPSVTFTADKQHSCDDGNDMIVAFTSGAAQSYQWNFGDGTTSTEASPVHTYSSAGLYDVTLAIIDEHGCVGQKTDSSFITKTNPVADFVVTDKYKVPHICVNQPLRITNTSTSVAEILDVQWDYLYDRSVETINTTDTIQYNKGGEYPIQITVTDAYGCVDSKTNILKVGDVSGIKAKVTAPTTYKFCPNTDIVFQAQESAGATSWSWIISSGANNYSLDTSISTTTLTLNFEASGKYSVLLIAYQYDCPSMSIGSASITIKPPTANFTYSPKALCSFPSTISFDPSTSVEAESYLWDFGDGTIIQVEPNATEGHYTVTDMVTNTVINADADTYIVSHEYTTANVYSVTLTTRNGTCEDAITIPLNTSGISVDVISNIHEICIGDTVQFTDNSVVELGTAATRTWTVSDGSDPKTVDTDTYTHIFTQAGTFNVGLEVVSSTGCSDSKIFNNIVQVYDNPTIQSLTADNSVGCADLSVRLSSEATAEGALKINSYVWDYGDGSERDTTRTNVSPVHKYQKGTFAPTVQVIDELGCTATSEPIAISATFPSPNFTIPEAICHDDTLKPENLSEGEGITSIWTWGDGTQSTESLHTYSVQEASEFNVKLTVTDENGCTDNIKKDILLQLPQADFFAIDDKTTFDCPPAKAYFKNTSIATKATYLWNFGESSSTLLSIPDSAFWQYQNVGEYDVMLVVKDNIGCADTLIREKYITVNGPVGHFKIEPESGCTYSTISMTAYDTKDVSQYSWVFGDGQFQNTTTGTVDYMYEEGNFYIPSLTIVDDNGCEISMVGNQVEILGVVPDFVCDTMLCDYEDLRMTDKSVANPQPIDRWTWTIQNTDYTEYINEQQFSQTFPAGVYNIQLKTEVGECVYTIQKNSYVQVNARPTIAITADKDFAICDFTSLPLKAKVLSGDDGNGKQKAQATWSGNGVVADSEDVLSAIFTAQSYDNNTVSVDYVSSYGCRMETPSTKDITVYPIPVSLNSINKEYCYGAYASQFDITTLLNEVSGTLTWYDAAMSQLAQTPVPETNVAGTQTYYVSQIEHDCESEKATITINVHPLPTPSIVASSDSVCQGTEIALGLEESYVSQQWSCGPTNYLSATDEMNPLFDSTANPGIYTVGVIVEDENGCKNDVEVKKTLVVLEIPVVDFDISKKAVEIFEDFTLENKIDTLRDDGKSVVWTWNIADVYEGTDYNVPFVFSEDGTYDITLSGYIHKECKDSVTKSFLVLPIVRIPNVFTPNGDGVNDVFFDGMPETELIIINRWGQELYKGMGGWDGTYNGKEMSAGTYFYMITLPNGKTYNGPLLLVRN